MAESPFVTVNEFARHLRVTPKTVRSWARDGLLPAEKYGKSWRIDTSGRIHVLSTSQRGAHPVEGRIR